MAAGVCVGTGKRIQYDMMSVQRGGGTNFIVENSAKKS